jgi:epsilon-lactone hydrolase
MRARIRFHGPPQCRLRSGATVYRSVIEASARRLFKGPRRTSWNWFMEMGTQVLRQHVATGFKIHDVNGVRRYLGSISFDSPVSRVTISPLSHGSFRGSWFVEANSNSDLTLLYLHGGGYSFYPRDYAQFVARITLAAKSKTFALDYRLSPEYRFPAQLQDALNAYRWLLDKGVNPSSLVVGGDSAGGNLTLALLLAARDAHLSVPALAFGLSPVTSFERDPTRTIGDQDADWIDRRMLERCADWFCDPSERTNPLVSPVLADLRGLPPIYIQAGRAEILYDSIQAFADRAVNHGASVVLEAWNHMNHDFQIFAPYVPQSCQALGRLGEVIQAHIHTPPSPQPARAACS